MHIFTPVTWVIVILFLFLVTHIYPCSHLQLEHKRLLNKIYKNIKWEKLEYMKKTLIFTPVPSSYIFAPVQSSYIFIQFCSIKYWKVWDFEYTALHPCSLIIHIYPCFLILYIFIPVQWSYIFGPVLISRGSRQGCPIKYRKA